MSSRLRVVGVALALCAALLLSPRARADEPLDGPWSSAFGTARARAVLLGRRPSEEPERVAAVELLARASESAAPDATLLAALEREQAPRVRVALLVALARRGRPELVPALVAVHRRGDSVERGLALRALAGIDSEVAVRELVLGLGAADSDETAVPALVRRGARAVPPVLRALREAPTASAAATALGALGDARAVAPLVSMLGAEREGDRVAALEALGALGDARAADAIAALVSSEGSGAASPPPGTTVPTPLRVATVPTPLRVATVPTPLRVATVPTPLRVATVPTPLRVGESPRVVIAALAALERVGDASHGAVILARVRVGSVEVRRAALAALVAADPVAGAAALRAVLGGDAPELLGGARALLLAARDPALAALLEERLAHDAQPAALAGALAALDGGAGVGALVRAASAGTAPLRRAVAGALAVAVRTWRAELLPGELSEAWDALSGACAPLPAGESLVLRAIARDARVVSAIRAALEDDALTPGASARRAAAALAAEALGARELAPAVLGALRIERDPESFRRLVGASRSVGAAAPLAPLLARAHDPETGPEALLLAAVSLSAASPDERREFAVLARAGLRASDERLRSSAARALALARDVRAARALLSATRDASPLVAVAAARALAALPAPASLAPELAAEARACADLRVRAALLDASDAARLGRPAPVETRGAEVLHVRLLLSGGDRADGIGVDVRLDDGRLLRRRTLPSGELFVLDLASGVADVTLRGESAAGP